MWIGAGLLAVLCLVFGVAPFLVIPSVVDAAGAIPGLHLAGALARGWNVALPASPACWRQAWWPSACWPSADWSRSPAAWCSSARCA